jgi:septum site-determining protein MinC
MSEYVQLKGTRAGVLLTVREECAFSLVIEQIDELLGAQADLLGTAPISVDLGWREVSDDEQQALCDALQGHGVSLLGVISTSLATRRLFELKGYKAIIGALGLAKHGGRARVRGASGDRREGEGAELDSAESGAEAAGLGASGSDEAAADPYAGSEPTLFLRKNLRSGQRIEFPGHVVVFGDVNHGAEVCAGGDIVVLGHVRGIVHAGCDGAEGARVVALNLHAPQVRIAEHRGLVEAKKQYQANVAVTSRVHEGAIVTSLLGG